MPATARTEARDLRRVALVAAAAAVVTRVPFAARRLWDHDSVQFALGVEKYDLAAHHPHPPGYPLYIAVLKLLAVLGVDSLHGMVALSILAAALGAGLIVPLTARLASAAADRGVPAARKPGLPSDASVAGNAGLASTAGVAGGDRRGLAARAARAGALAAALYVFNPLLWFYGELPLVYAVEGGMTVGLAYAALRMADGRGPFLAACAAFALAGGVRPSTLVLLLPLFLLGAWHAWRRGATAGTMAAGAALGAAVGLAWLAPLLAAAGGLAAYRRIGSEHFSALLPYTSILYGAGWKALAHNLTIMTKWFLQGLVPVAVALGALWLPLPRRRAVAAPAQDRRTSGAGAGGEGDGGSRSAAAAAGIRLLAMAWPWLAAWAVPPILFFALFHVTKAGYTLIYLPALLVAASLLGAPAMDGRRERRTAAAILLAAMTGAGLFLFGADRRPDQPRALAVVRNEFNRAAIATYERDLDALLAALRRLPPATTVLATVELSGTGPAGPEGFLYPWQRHLQWYLPDYEVLLLVPEDGLAFVTRGHRPFHREGPRLELPAGTRQLAIILSGPTGDRFPLSAWPLRRIGDTFYLVVVPVQEGLRLGPFTFAVPHRQAA
jgi:transmembrane protein TMEM260 (protein O-mannosyltransferase)